jgi:hypothetical protein
MLARIATEHPDAPAVGTAKAASEHIERVAAAPRADAAKKRKKSAGNASVGTRNAG